MSDNTTKNKQTNSTKNVYFSNIPRRKIYEEMMNFEEGLMELDILQYNQINFDKFKDKYNKDTLHSMKQSYHNVKSLMIMFLENRKYAKEQEYLQDLKLLNSDQKTTNKCLRLNKNLTLKNKYFLLKLDYIFRKHNHLENLNQAQKVYKDFIKFNDLMPTFLELRRDNMK